MTGTGAYDLEELEALGFKGARDYEEHQLWLKRTREYASECLQLTGTFRIIDLRGVYTSHPALQLAQPNGNHPMSAAVWTAEHNGDKGLPAALENCDVWGGWVFVSETTPGYVVWFDTTHTPTEILLHDLTLGHSGKLY